jgi:hypothetical protein
MGTTPNYAIPYPELVDPPDGAGQMKALANRVDTVIKPIGDRVLTGLSTARPAVVVGSLLFETDTNRIMVGVSVSGVSYWVPLPGTYLLSVRQTAQQSFADATYAALQFGAVDYNPYAAWTANTKFQPRFPGWFLMTGAASFSNNQVGMRLTAWYKNGTQLTSNINQGFVPGGGAATAARSNPIYLNGTTDYAELWAYQNSGAALLTSVSAGWGTMMSVVYIGP